MHNKSVGFSLASFDLLRFWTTLHFQTYARKTHADYVSVHKPYLKM